jgi:rare lipoprotein A (peptidoglycan hydrolase)
MTPTLRTRPATSGRHRATRGRHRAARDLRRPARYAAAGLLAVAGAVAAAPVVTAGPDRPAVVAPVVRPAAMASPQVVQRRPAPARTATRARYRWVRKHAYGPDLRGRATWYGPGFHGRRTASGSTFDSYGALTAAHRTLPFGTRLRVCLRGCVVVTITDRGPFGPAMLDLSHLAASRIGLLGPGIATVTANVVTERRVRVRV